MSKITADMWWRANNKLNQCYLKYEQKGLVLQECYCAKLIDRYDDGERSIELYNAIMELC